MLIGEGPSSVTTALPLPIGPLLAPSRYSLAPLAGYTTLAFRLAVRELGGLGLATTDLINARALVRGSPRTLEMLRTCPADRPLAVQIYGTDPGEMAAAAQWLEGYGVSAVDINMGCPVHKVTRGGGGSALMCDSTEATTRLVASVVKAVRLPVTVKMRLGWDDTSLNAPLFARAFEDVGVAAVTIHGRTREQGFGGTVNLAGIRAVVEAVARIPVLGNGDVRNVADAEQMMAVTGCTGVAIGRGALLNPWIFAQLVEREQAEPTPGAGSFFEHLDFMHRHFKLLVADRGERFGCLLFRKVANWYCRVLRPGHVLQQRMVRISFSAEVDEIVQILRERGPVREALQKQHQGPSIAVPKGPISYW